MSVGLDKARDLFAAGKDKKARDALWQVEALARTDANEAQGLLELASAIRDRNTGRVRDEAEALVVCATGHLDRIAHQPVPPLAVLNECRALECDGLNVGPDETLNLVFTSEAALIRKREGNEPELARVEYRDIDEFGVEEIPKQSSARRTAGKAALGMSLGVLSGSGDAGWSAADKLLESYSSKLTLVTPDREMAFLHVSREPIETLRSRLAEVRIRIADSGRQVDHEAATSIVERLTGLLQETLALPTPVQKSWRSRNRPQGVFVIVSAVADPAAYVQWATSDAGLQVEIADPEKNGNPPLTSAQRGVIEALGFHPGSPNFERAYPTAEASPGQIAQLLASGLENVFGVTAVRELDIAGPTPFP